MPLAQSPHTQYYLPAACAAATLPATLPALPPTTVATVYESEEYYRASVAPQLEDGSSIPADVYVWKEQYK